VNHEVTGTRPPIEWCAEDGTRLAIRNVQAGDAAILMSFVRGLSFGARYFRFGHGDIEFSAEDTIRACTPDPNECEHLLILKIADQSPVVIASGRIVFPRTGTTCEVALAVTDAWQKRGIGTSLLNALFKLARDRGLREMHGRILASNRRMIKFMREHGFKIADSDEGPAVKIASISL
jgi:acetyltransferase